MADVSDDAEAFHIVLFYRYVRLAEVDAVAQQLQDAMDSAEGLSGRILLAEEGVNGNLAAPEAPMQHFLAQLLDIKALGLAESDIKSSRTTSDTNPFPDLRLRRVKHLIAGGDVLDSIPIEETAQGYLSPADWLEAARMDDAVLIDVRNVRETAIGHFEGALDPKTKHFSEFARWLDSGETQSKLRDKRVLMYCTGGVRCEKASALLRRRGVAKSVEHLHGGIHRFQEDLGDAGGFWKGKMFVFDRRGSMRTADFCGAGEAADAGNGQAIQEGSDAPATDRGSVVGKCLYCAKAHDIFHPDAVCVVCREPCLACDDCRTTLDGEYHCETHTYLRTMYFGSLEKFSDDSLRRQKEQLETELDKIRKGKEFRNRRRTLSRQIDRVRDVLRGRFGDAAAPLDGGALQSGECDGSNSESQSSERQKSKRQRSGSESSGRRKCRSCGEVACRGDCWGFWGTKRAVKRIEVPKA